MKKQKKENGSGTFRIVNGKYNYRFFYIDEFGEKKRKSFSGVTKDECLHRAEEFLEKQGKRAAAVDPDITIPELLRRKYEEDYAMNFVGEQGYARNLGGIALLERSGFGKMPIVNITEMQIKAFLRSMTKYSDSVIKKTYQQLTSAFKVAVEKGVVERNPMDASDIRRPKSSKKPKDVRGFTQEEQARFLEALRDFKVPRNRNEYKLQLLIELYSGMRMGDDDDKIRLNQRKPSKYKGLRRFGPEKNLQRINKFMKERPIFYKNLIQMKENIRFYLRCFYCITKVMILQFNSENRTELARNG